jgi:hypothetical protein
MEMDPEFVDTTGKKAVPAPPLRRVGRWLIYSLLGCSGFHFLGTGSPIPLWHIERLNHPVAVRAIGEDALELRDGGQVRLPFIKKLPKADPCFVKALRHGVEVGPDGEVFGLIDPARMCGNDPVVFYRKRINLSDLAGVLDPDGIDEAIVDPEGIKDFKENSFNRSRDRRGMPFSLSIMASRVRDIYKYSASKAKEEAVVTRTFSLN